MRPQTATGGSDVQHRIAMAKAEALKRKELEEANNLKMRESAIFKADKDKSQGGLNVAFHR
jgi:hypothetical protein